MAGLQGHTCWADTAAVFQTLHPHTIRFTYGFAQITLMHAVGLLSPGTPQIQVCCMFIWFFYLSSLVCLKLHFQEISTQIPWIQWTISCKYVYPMICTFICLFLCLYLCFVHMECLYLCTGVCKQIIISCADILKYNVFILLDVSLSEFCTSWLIIWRCFGILSAYILPLCFCVSHILLGFEALPSNLLYYSHILCHWHKVCIR